MKESTQIVLIGLAIVIVTAAATLPTNRAQWSDVPTNSVSSRAYTTNFWVGGGATNAVYLDAAAILVLARDSGEMTNLVNLLVTSGEFCRVRGHVWHYGGKVEDHFYGLTFEDAFKNARKCAVCGKVESRTVHSWPSETAQVTILTNIAITNITNTPYFYWDDTLKKYLPLDDFVERRDLPH